MERIGLQAFEYALGKINDGFLFEQFSQEFLSHILGEKFSAVGGIRDRGIDGLEHIFSPHFKTRNIYQASIEKDSEGKIIRTLNKLSGNSIEYDLLVYVTNKKVDNQDKLIDELFVKYQKPVRIYDVSWFTNRVNSTQSTINLYYSFVSTYMHEFERPGKSIELGDLVTDPRLFVFLRQQWEEKRKDLALDAILADTLILFCLEGTDPDKRIFKTKDEVKSGIARLIHFDPQLLYSKIDERLGFLSKKPRQIKYHQKENGYCLPYETRTKIQERNLIDVALYDQFVSDSRLMLQSHLKDQEISVEDCMILIEDAIRRLYYQQGLEFSNFMLKGEGLDAIEKNVNEIVSHVLDNNTLRIKSREKVRAALMLSLRDLVYNGTEAQRTFLRKLSNTYMMLFMLQCDPKLSTYFTALSSKLEVYVCTSIIIPAMSEFYLEPANRRHWNLLKGAQAAGVSLVINESIVDELVAHFSAIKHIYKREYQDAESVYLDEMQMLYVDEIMIRAYFYARMQRKVTTFDQFLDSFVNPDLSDAEDSLVEWLKGEFGVTYRPNKSIDVTIDKGEENALLEQLRPLKKHHTAKARSDVRVILTIYGLREKNNEMDSAGVWGYKTWWLSKDSTTYKVVSKLFHEKYKVSCYMRPDFLYNFIALAPTNEEVKNVYQELFPSLVGANISFHLPSELTEFVHQRIAEHKTKSPARIKAILRELSEKLKYDPTYQTRRYVEHYLDEELKMIEAYKE
jgi:hypothetical protein